MANERAAFDYNVRIKGLFGRNRKIKSETLKLVECAPAPLPLEQVKALALAAIHEAKCKPGTKYTICEYPVTVADNESSDGTKYQTKLFALFSDRMLDAGTV